MSEPIRTYGGVRVSKREAQLLDVGDALEGAPVVLRTRVGRELLAKVDAIRDAIERFQDYRPGDPLIDRRAER